MRENNDVAHVRESFRIGRNRKEIRQEINNINFCYNNGCKTCCTRKKCLYIRAIGYIYENVKVHVFLLSPRMRKYN